FQVNGNEVFVTASVGIALSVTGYDHPQEALRDAHTATYRAKSLGKAQCAVFDTVLIDSAQNQRQLEADLKRALEQQEFVLFYQPIVSFCSNRIAGFEALVRWNHPDRGLVLPSEFIPVAESTGLILPLGRWISREACRQLKLWQEELRLSGQLWVSLNFSSLEFMQPSVVDHLGDVLRESGLDPHSVVLELTEAILMRNPTAASSLLMKLRVMGARIALDDFGTGYSSLSYLRQFPVDYLKIDYSFVRRMQSSKDMLEIVRTIVDLAHQLGLHVIAEGIETKEQM